MAKERVDSDHDLLSSYLREIGRYPQLTVDEERALARRIRDGDTAAVEELVRCNLRFVVSYAKKFRSREIQFLDLIEEGNIGLMQAARRFDPDKDVKFITYAVWWVRQAILQALAEQTRAFRVPPRQASLLNKLDRAVKSSLEADEGVPTNEALADELDVSVSEVTTLMEASGMSQSLSHHLGSNLELGELLEQSLIDPADEAYQRSDDRTQLLAELDQLSPRERLVLMLRYGFGPENPQSIADLASLFECEVVVMRGRLSDAIGDVCERLSITRNELSHLLLFRNADPTANWRFWVLLHDHPDQDSVAVTPQRRDIILEVNQTGALQQALTEIDPYSMAVLLLRYGVLDDESFTLQQIGDMLGVSRERVRQIEARAESHCRKSVSKDS